MNESKRVYGRYEPYACEHQDLCRKCSSRHCEHDQRCKIPCKLWAISKSEEAPVNMLIERLHEDQKLNGVSIDMDVRSDGHGTYIKFGLYYPKKIYLVGDVIAKAGKIFTEEKERLEQSKIWDIELAKRQKILGEARKCNTEKFHLGLGPALGSLYFNIKYAKTKEDDDGYSSFKLNLENGITVSCKINDDYSTQTITGMEGVDTTKVIKFLNE